MARNVIIMGAAGRDFHNFNVFFRNRPEYNVVAFTATQIPDIDGRTYPAVLSGENYPNGIPIYDETELVSLIKKHNIEEVVFSYSDISHVDLMHKASTVMAAGASFTLLGPDSTCIASKLPLISVCAVRTGVGKSQTTRAVCSILKKHGLRVVAIRHPMPYGDLSKQICQRFATYEDLDKHNCTIEEREEYAPHIESDIVVYAGVDYEVILREAEKEADVILWDGGNNDFPFYKSDLQIVLVDPLRPGHEILYHPGEANLKMADCIIVNKVDSATPEQLAVVRENIKKNNPSAAVIETASVVSCDNPELVRGKKVLVIEDGPTLTHGEMSYGAGVVLAKKLNVAEMLDARPYAQGSIKGVYEKYPHMGALLPAMGYSDKQIAELQATVESVPCEVIVVGTPIDLRKVLTLDKPSVRVAYEMDEKTKPQLEQVMSVVTNRFVKK